MRFQKDAKKGSHIYERAEFMLKNENVQIR